MKRWLVVLAAVLIVQAAVAIDSGPAFDDPAQQVRYERLARQLRCLVCQNQTIADSNATLAGDLRRELREMMIAGKNDAEILGFMTDRYGDFVRYKPPVTPRTWLLWATPVLLLFAGAGAAVVVIVRKSRQPQDDSPEPESL